MKLFFPLGLWKILLNEETGDNNYSSGAKKRRIIIAITIAVTLVLVASVILLIIDPNLIHDNLTRDNVLKSTDMPCNNGTVNGSWNQTSTVTKYYDFLNLDPSPYASQLSTESSTSSMMFINSTMNVSVTVSLMEFRNGEAAKDQFFQDKGGNDQGAAGILSLNGTECFIIHVESPANNSADILQTIIFHKGSMEGAVYMAGEGLTRGNYSFLTNISEMQVSRL